MLGVITALIMYIIPIALDIVGFAIGDYSVVSVGLIWLIASLVITGTVVLVGYVEERRKDKGV